MPWGRPRKEDPFARIKSWDDGYEHIRSQGPSPSASREPTGYFPPMTPRSARGDSYEEEYSRRPSRRDDGNYTTRRAYPSPPSDYDGHGRSSRRRRGSSPPPPYRPRGSSSPVRRSGTYEARPAPPYRSESWRSPHDVRHGAPPLQRSMSTREAQRPRSYYSRSPSPPPRRRYPDRGGERMHGGSGRYSSPSPPPRRRDRERHRGVSPPPTPSGDRYGRSTRHRSPSPLPKSYSKQAPHRPNISRSKSTSAKAGFAGLSPRWQQAATAAFKAGSQAVLQARSQPGKWNGEKGARVATAALGAAAMHALKKNKDDGRARGSSTRGGGRKNSGVEVIGGALGNFLADQFVKRKR